MYKYDIGLHFKDNGWYLYDDDDYLLNVSNARIRIDTEHSSKNGKLLDKVRIYEHNTNILVVEFDACKNDTYSRFY